MATVAAIHWNSKKHTLSHMIIDDTNLQVKVAPQEIYIQTNNVPFIRNTINNFLHKLSLYAKDSKNVVVQYKTYTTQYRGAKAIEETKTIEKELNTLLSKYHFHKQKLKSLLTIKGGLRRFSNLIKSEVYKNKAIQVYIVHLWEIAFHVTPKKLEKALEKIESISRLNTKS